MFISFPLFLKRMHYLLSYSSFFYLGDTTKACSQGIICISNIWSDYIQNSFSSSNKFASFADQRSCFCSFNFGFLGPTNFVFKRSVHKQQLLRFWLWKGYCHKASRSMLFIILERYVLKFFSFAYLCSIPSYVYLRFRIFCWKKTLIWLYYPHYLCFHL